MDKSHKALKQMTDEFQITYDTFTLEATKLNEVTCLEVFNNSME